ncbi:MAG: F0F1 ATP synthase subunit delta, partial [Christensenellales bacterium]
MIRNNTIKIEAILYSAAPPTDLQREELIGFLKHKYNDDVSLTWKEDKKLRDGLRLEVGIVSNFGSPSPVWTLDRVYDWSLESRLQQLKEDISQLSAQQSHLVPLIRETIKDWTPKALAQEVGTVLSVGDGIATVSGLPNATYQEILIFSSGVRGMVQELKRDEIGCILFDDSQNIVEGSQVKRTGKTAGIPVGDQFKGRVIDAMGNPIDGQGS